MKILTSVWSAQHSNSGQNIQQLSSKNGIIKSKFGNLISGLSSKNGTIAGCGIVTYDKESKCYTDKGVEFVNGTFVDGQLEGMATIQFANLTRLRAPFSKGVISGLTR